MRPVILLLTVLLTICFSTIARGTELPEKCRQLPERGPCKAMFEKFYFNHSTNTCKPYFYGGCGPEAVFDTLEDCVRLCGKPEEPKKKRAGLYYDPVEDDPRHAEVFRKIDDEVKETLAAHPKHGSMGFVHIVWETKQRILKRKYNIDWKSPAELNPQVLFD